MQVILERFENNQAILELESGNHVVIPKILVETFEEGDIIDIIKNEEETKKCKEDVESIMNRLFQ